LLILKSVIKMLRPDGRLFGGLLAGALLLSACGGGPSASPGASGPVPPAAALTGAGATFPAPFYSAAFYAYNKKFPQVTVNYGSLGSGTGIQQFTNKTVDFGASDVPLNDEEAAALGGRDKVVQIPTTLGTVSLAYNLAGVSSGSLKLTPELIAGIFLGTIKKWNDPALRAQNGSLTLPDQAISVVRRSDGSGTTYIFTDYLSRVSPDWKTKVGTGKAVSWPTGQGGKGNEAVATLIKQTPGAIGYVELAYVIQTRMSQAAIRNASGNFVVPSADGATAAAKASSAVTPTAFSIVNAPGKDSAPISGFSWAMLYKEQPNKDKGTALVDLLYWLVSSEGQRYAADLYYARLPDTVSQQAVTALKTVTFQGKALLSTP
jgi:phosphate transport system substrate-binding protein